MSSAAKSASVENRNITPSGNSEHGLKSERPAWAAMNYAPANESKRSLRKHKGPMTGEKSSQASGPPSGQKAGHMDGAHSHQNSRHH